MNAEKESLQKLLRAARKARPSAVTERDSSAPIGFATRIAAHWAAMSQRLTWADYWERLSWWGAGVATAICLACLVHQTVRPQTNPFDELIEIELEEVTTF